VLSASSVHQNSLLASEMGKHRLQYLADRAFRMR
jgi:hypothetical protein